MADASQELDDRKKAFYTILAAAVLIDDKLRPLERVELEALMLRTRTLSKLQEASREQLRLEVTRKLRKSFESNTTRYDRIDEACNVLIGLEPSHKGICESAFLHALDLTHTDDHMTRGKDRASNGLHAKEVDYLKHLAHRFNLKWETTNDDNDTLMSLKNRL